MSITGHSHSLTMRGRQRDQGVLPEQSTRSNFSRQKISQSAETAENHASDRPKQFPLKQSLLKQSLPKSARLHLIPAPLVRPRDVRSISDVRTDRPSQNETNSQDARPALPRHRDNAKIQVQPGEVPLLNVSNGIEHKPKSQKKPGIVVVHQRAFFRDCFVRCLEVAYKSHEIFAFASISAWRDCANQNAQTPTVIVFFVDGSDLSSIVDLQFLETAAIDIPVVVMSDIDDVNYVVRALKGGARGYIPTSLSFNVAVEAVRLVEAGGTFVPASSLQLDRDKPVETKTNGILTERQLMVVEALCQGMANKQIAYELSMSEHTVKVHLRHIMRKLKARNRTEVAVLTKDFF